MTSNLHVYKTAISFSIIQPLYFSSHCKWNHANRAFFYFLHTVTVLQKKATMVRVTVCVSISRAVPI